MELLLGAVLLLVGYYSTPKAQESSRPAKFAYINQTDTKDKHLVSSEYAGNSKGMYFKAIQEKTINFERTFSCFKNESSVNYIGFNDSEIDNLRPFASSKEYEIQYRSIASMTNNVSTQSSVEAKNYRISIRHLSCFKIINNQKVRVVSEIYEKEMK